MDILKIFRIIGAEFKDIPDEDEVDEEGNVIKYGLITYINLWQDQISRKRFGKSYNKALCYLICHKLKMMGYGEDNGLGSIADSMRVTSYSEGETSISFGTSSALNKGADGDYELTLYGLEFLKLRKNAIVPILSAGEGPPHVGF